MLHASTFVGSLGADDPAGLAEIVIEKGLNVRQTEALVRAGGIEAPDTEDTAAPVSTPAAARTSGPADPNTQFCRSWRQTSAAPANPAAPAPILPR